MNLWRISRIALASLLLTPALPVAVLAQSVPENSASVQKAALGRLSQDDRAQVQNILALLAVGQMDPITAAAQIDATLSDNEAGFVLDEAKKANIDAQDAGTFLASLVHPTAAR